MKRITVPAETAQLEGMNAFIDDILDGCGCPAKVRLQVELAVEEIFVNIASYAYHPERGETEVCVDTHGDPPTVTITFIDHGKPFNPLDRPDADVTLPAEERGIGGLGILLVKKNMDDVTYSYENGKNILTITKRLEAAT